MKQEFAISQTKAAAAGSLRDSLGAVSAALSAIPDNVVRLPSNMADAFLMVDPVLSMLHRQLLDARANNAALEAMCGGDAMMEALAMQVSALEEAYAARMAALKKRREEGRKNNARDSRRKKVSNVVVTNPFEVRERMETPKRQNDSLWLWVLIVAYMANQATMRTSGPRLDAA